MPEKMANIEINLIGLSLPVWCCMTSPRCKSTLNSHFTFVAFWQTPLSTAMYIYLIYITEQLRVKVLAQGLPLPEYGPK